MGDRRMTQTRCSRLGLHGMVANRPLPFDPGLEERVEVVVRLKATVPHKREHLSTVFYLVRQLVCLREVEVAETGVPGVIRRFSLGKSDGLLETVSAPQRDPFL